MQRETSISAEQGQAVRARLKERQLNQSDVARLLGDVRLRSLVSLWLDGKCGSDKVARAVGQAVGVSWCRAHLRQVLHTLNSTSSGESPSSQERNAD